MERGMRNTGNARRRRRRAPVRSYLSCEGKHGQWNTECGTRNTEMHAEGVGGLRVSTLGWVFLNRFALEGHQEPHLKERAGSIPDLEGINSGAHSGRPALNAVTQG